jgi:hypothetical protein
LTVRSSICFSSLVFCIRVSNWCFSIFLVPILELQHAPLPPKCYKVGSVPQLFTLSIRHFIFTFESIKELGNGHPLTPKVLQVRECAPILSFFRCFTMGPIFGPL